mmetsp:Transcript_39561/g.64162  ORF Transcript_39561/g.64162 Transcript_39561/m.64162 type:complete len:95 (-) Transcript_39561:1514-1798(-)
MRCNKPETRETYHIAKVSEARVNRHVFKSYVRSVNGGHVLRAGKATLGSNYGHLQEQEGHRSGGVPPALMCKQPSHRSQGRASRLQWSMDDIKV